LYPTSGFGWTAIRLDPVSIGIDDEGGVVIGAIFAPHPRHDFAVRFETVLMRSPLLLPVAGGRRKKEKPAIDPAAVVVRSRKKA